jgi:hypothetical protein
MTLGNFLQSQQLKVALSGKQEQVKLSSIEAWATTWYASSLLNGGLNKYLKVSAYNSSKVTMESCRQPSNCVFTLRLDGELEEQIPSSEMLA